MPVCARLTVAVSVGSARREAHHRPLRQGALPVPLTGAAALQPESGPWMALRLAAPSQLQERGPGPSLSPMYCGLWQPLIKEAATPEDPASGHAGRRAPEARQA